MPKKKTGERPKQQEPKPDAETTAAAPAAPAPAASSEDSSDETTPTPAATKAPTKAATPATEALAAAASSEGMEGVPGKPTNLKFLNDLVPVDREIEIEMLLRITKQNWDLRGSNHPSVLFSSQMFGAGKSFFARHLQSALREDMERDGPITRALLDRPVCSCDLLEDLRFDQKGSWGKELIRTFIDAQFVEVELKFSHTSIKDIHASLFSKATERCFIPAGCTSLDDPNVWAKLRRLDGNTVPKTWFIFFDEIGVLEESNLTKTFLNSLGSLLRNPNCIVFCAGRSETLVFSSVNSLVPRVMLVLGPLKVPHIIEIQVKTKMQAGKMLYQQLGALSIEKQSLLAEVVYVYTGGIPRFVRFALEKLAALASLHPIEFEKEKLCKLMDGPVREFIKERCTLGTGLLSEKPEYRNLFSTLLFLSLTGKLIERSMMIETPSGQKSIADVATSLALYLEPVGKYVKIVFSKYTSDYLKSLRGVARSPLLDVMNSALTLPVGLFSPGNTLLFLFAERLWHFFCVAEFVGDIPGFEGSILAKIKLVKKAKDPFALRYIPSFSTSVKSGTHTTTKIDHQEVPHNFGPTDWGLLFQKCMQELLNRIGLPIDDNSAGPDALVFLANLLEELAGMIMFALKNYQNEGAMDWEEIAQEVKKGLVNAVNSEPKLPDCPKLLVIVATRYTQNVQKAFESTTPDGFKFASFPAGTKFTKRSKDKAKEVVTIPEGCELRIFSVELIKQFLGEHVMKVLKDLFNKDSGLTSQALDELRCFHQSMFVGSSEQLTPIQSKGKRPADRQPPPSPPLSAAAAPGSFDGAATSHAAHAPAAAPVVERHLLFQDSDQEITIEWMRAVNEQFLHVRTRPGETLDEKLGRIITKFDENDVFTVGGLIKLDQESMERCGIPVAIARELFLQCHPEKR